MKKHWVVLVLPAILMVVIALSGFYYLQQDEEMTNEELKEEIEITATKLEDGLVEIEWEWPKMPAEGIYGTDYIGIAFDGADANDVGTVTLLVEPERSMDGERVGNGFIYSFPTVMEEHQSVGTKGKIVQDIPDDVSEVTVSLLHTWTSHSELTFEDALFNDPSFGNAENVQYWVLNKELSDLLEN
ncbi:hypothetical protein [Bacillus sp. JCM 19041]|uniref:hypothetical protein n=1 Tax=Bacillus sp. JCM 19041 TaxID=1460637 RepID=UPI0006D2C407